MNELTKKLQETDHFLEKVGVDFSSAAKNAYKYAMRVTAFQKAQPKELNSARKKLKQSEKNLTASLKSDDTSKSTIAQMTHQSETAATSTLVAGLKKWTITLLSPETAFEKTQKLK